jgi:hypothetical protein
MKIMRFFIKGLILLSLLLVFSCGTTRKLKKDDSQAVSSAVVDYGRKVMKNVQTEQSVTAKVRVKAMADGKDVTVNGSLRMMRDDVIQLSLSMLGFELGRMEFLRDEVLIIDRFHKQYVRVPYSDVDFLNKTNIDFNALQAIFWGELFIPGMSDVVSQLNRFSMSSSGEHTLLTLKDEPRLEYDFLVNTATALLDRTMISPKDLTQTGEFVCRYSDYTKLSGKQFPKEIELNFTGEGTKMQLILSLSDLNNKTGWPTRTEVSSKYKQVDAKGILRKLIAQ